MKQVKFFSNRHQHALEKEITDFIKNKNVVSVSYSTSSGGCAVYHYCCVVYLVL